MRSPAWGPAARRTEQDHAADAFRMMAGEHVQHDTAAQAVPDQMQRPAASAAMRGKIVCRAVERAEQRMP